MSYYLLSIIYQTEMLFLSLFLKSQLPLIFQYNASSFKLQLVSFLFFGINVSVFLYLMGVSMFLSKVQTCILYTVVYEYVYVCVCQIVNLFLADFHILFLLNIVAKYQLIYKFLYIFCL